MLNKKTDLLYIIDYKQYKYILMINLMLIICYQITFNSFPILIKAVIALSICAGS